MLTLLRVLPVLLRYCRRTRVLGLLMGLRLGGALMECTGQALVALSVMALRRIEANIWKRSYPTQASGPSQCLERYPALSTRHPSLLTGLDVNITIAQLITTMSNVVKMTVLAYLVYPSVPISLRIPSHAAGGS